MELKDIVAKLEQSKEYKEWKESHKDTFLAHAFVMLDEPNKNTWQMGYFDSSKNKMTTFVVSSEKIDMIPDQEVLKTDQKITPLNVEDVTLTVAEALDLAQKARVEHYSKEITAKTFFIIQNLEAHGPVFNITYFTAAFKTVNIKISTKNGEVLHHSVQALAAFG